VPEERYRN